MIWCASGFVTVKGIKRRRLAQIGPVAKRPAVYSYEDNGDCDVEVASPSDVDVEVA